MRTPGLSAAALFLAAALAQTGCAARTAPQAPDRTSPHPTAPDRTSHPSAPDSTRPHATALLAADLSSLYTKPELEHAHLAILVRSLLTGETLYALNERRMMVPASNQKLLTVAGAARTLGWDFRYTTRVLATGTLRSDGTLDGNLVVVGSGDPTINPRHPDRWRALDDWAGQIAARGVRVINGHLIGDDNAFAEPGWGSGWSWDDLVADYGSPVGSLQYHENEVELLIGPGMEPGRPAIISSAPLGHGLLVDNEAVTVSADQPTRVSIDRVPGTIMLNVRGQVAELIVPLYRVFHLDFLFLREVAVEGADTVEVAVDRFGAEPFVQKVIDEAKDFLSVNLFNGTIEPEDKLLEGSHVVSHRTLRVVLPLEGPPEVDDRVNNCHRSLLSRSGPSP